MKKIKCSDSNRPRATRTQPRTRSIEYMTIYTRHDEPVSRVPKARTKGRNENEKCVAWAAALQPVLQACRQIVAIYIGTSPEDEALKGKFDAAIIRRSSPTGKQKN